MVQARDWGSAMACAISWVTLADPALVLLQCLPQNYTWFYYYQFSSNPPGNRMILFWFLGQNRLILKVLWKDAVGTSQPHTPQGQRRGERSHVLSALTPYSFIFQHCPQVEICAWFTVCGRSSMRTGLVMFTTVTPAPRTGLEHDTLSVNIFWINE